MGVATVTSNDIIFPLEIEYLWLQVSSLKSILHHDPHCLHEPYAYLSITYVSIINPTY